jgi:hypothetical protein
MRVGATFNLNELSDELQALKSEVSQLLNAGSDGMFDAAVSINERGKMHTYRVTTVSHL